MEKYISIFPIILTFQIILFFIIFISILLHKKDIVTFT
jgi:hypothetical protein